MNSPSFFQWAKGSDSSQKGRGDPHRVLGKVPGIVHPQGRAESTAARCRFAPTRTAAVKGPDDTAAAEDEKHSGENAKRCLRDSRWKTVLQLLIKIHTHLPYDPEIPLLASARRKRVCSQGTRTGLFPVAVPVTDTLWKQPKSPSAVESTSKSNLGRNEKENSRTTPRSTP